MIVKFFVSTVVRCFRMKESCGSSNGLARSEEFQNSDVNVGLNAT